MTDKHNTPCCDAMGYAIAHGYIEWPMTYTKDKQVSRLTPILNSEGKPGLILNNCPWCKEALSDD
jgi:hypothetical protein